MSSLNKYSTNEKCQGDRSRMTSDDMMTGSIYICKALASLITHHLYMVNPVTDGGERVSRSNIVDKKYAM